MKALVFDMDGTIADLYNVDNWLYDLRHGSVRPYLEAKPIYDMNKLCAVLERLQFCGWMICITSWVAIGASKEYSKAIKQAKKQWLDDYGFPYDKISVVKYGRTKADSTRKLGGYQILFDDNEKIRKSWTLGDSVDANENIIPFLENLLVA